MKAALSKCYEALSENSEYLLNWHTVWRLILVCTFFFGLKRTLCLYGSKENCMITGADPGIVERGFICIKGEGFVLLILSHFLRYPMKMK